MAAAGAERRAWLILWTAFATFCVVALAALRFALDYVATADIDLTAHTEASRGIVFVKNTEGAEARLQPERELAVSSMLETARAGSLTVRFFEGSRMTLLSEARVQLARMDVGRFISRETLVLRQENGPVRYQATHEIRVDVPEGVVWLSPGDATVWVDTDRTRVLLYEGEARLELDGASRVVRAQERGEMTAQGQLIGPLPRTTQLLENNDFARRTDRWIPIDVQNGPRDVDGQRLFGPGPTIDGQTWPALRIRRDSVAAAHGETGLQQSLDLDVSGYRHLSLEAWVKVDSASLSGGGQLGSEYPMMLGLRYEGVPEGSRPNWAQGFYATNPEDRPVINAEQVPAGEWVRYRVDLMDQEEARRPYRLQELEVLGQGHSYDASVANVRLIGD